MRFRMSPLPFCCVLLWLNWTVRLPTRGVTRTRSGGHCAQGGVEGDAYGREIKQYREYARHVDCRLTLDDQAPEPLRRSDELTDDRADHGEDDGRFKPGK